jgi:hypothetical protein
MMAVDRMRQATIKRTCVVGVFAAGFWTAWAQAPVASPSAAPEAASQAAPAPVPSQTTVGGRLYGTVKSGNVPLPGVTVVALNTLTGKRFSTTTDITGAWSMKIPQNGRYVVRTEFAAFAQSSLEALLNASSHEQTLNFELTLASRATQQEQASSKSEERQTIRQMAGNAPANLSLTTTLTADVETGTGVEGASGAALPSIATNSDFSGESVAVSGQTGQVSANVGMGGPGGDMGGGLFGGPGGGFGAAFGGGGGFGGGGFGGGPGGGGPGGGGPGGFGGGPGGGGRGNFRSFNANQPHGSLSWNGSNSVFNAQPFSLAGQSQSQPSNGSNQFSASLMSTPYIPHLLKASGKDTIFLSLSDTRKSTPEDEYATLPTADERQGIFSASGLAAIYDPVTLAQFSNNTIPLARIKNLPAYALLNCSTTDCQPLIPYANLSDNSSMYNYHRLTTEQSNSTQFGARYMRTLGANAAQQSQRGYNGARRSTQNQGLRQSVNLNYNWSHSASDAVNFIPELGGKTATHSYSLQAGYSASYHRFTSMTNVNWNRNNSQTRNFFTDTTNNIASSYGISVPNNIPINYGLPNISLSSFTGISEQEPSVSLSQTIALSETLSWRHGKHNLRFGGDYRRVHNDFLAGTNATGSFTFTGLFTEDSAQDSSTGSALADFLLGLPQQSTLNSSEAKSYLRDNTYDAYLMDDWRVTSTLTLNYGVRWEYYAPYTEKYNHLAEVSTSPTDGFSSLGEITAGSSGLPDSLVYPWRKAFAPRLGLAWRVPKLDRTVVRAGFGMNYTVGEYSSFAQKMAHQPPYTNEQTNEESVNNSATSACARSATSTCFTLSDGFPSAATIGSYALKPHYGMPYLMTWNIDVQRTLPWGLVMNLGYNGSRANHLDTVLAPRAVPSSPSTDSAGLVFSYEEAQSFSKFNAGTVRLNKRLSTGFSVGANYTYSHSIDDAGALGSVGGTSVQDWTNPKGELGHSTIDVRHKVSGQYMYELPFGPDKYWITTGKAAHVLEGFSASGNFTFASGTWLSPSYSSSVASTACGTGGVMRPNLTGASVTAGGGTLNKWFNTSAYSAPTATSGYCDYFGNAPRNSIVGPGTVTNDMSLAKTIQVGSTRSMEVRAIIDNVFNTVQYSSVSTDMSSSNFGQVTRVGDMRSFQFTARFRF